jgi:hypothetical protein
MWKIAIAVMILATSTFGAVTLTVPQETQTALTAGTVLTVPITLTNTGITNADALAQGAGKIQLTGRAFNAASMITDPTTANGAIPLPLTLQATKNAKDLGSTGSTDPLPAGSTLYATLTFALTGDVEKGTKISLFNASYNEDMGNNWAFDAGTNLTTTLVPEPASMLLLAAGAAFFARRRRA